MKKNDDRKLAKKLELHRETLKNLAESQLKNVAGGYRTGGSSCRFPRCTCLVG